MKISDQFENSTQEKVLIDKYQLSHVSKLPEAKSVLVHIYAGIIVAVKTVHVMYFVYAITVVL